MKNKSLILLTIMHLMLITAAYSMGPAVGGELTYKYINDSTYRFYYKFYAACSGFPEANEISMCYRNTNCGGIWYTERLAKMVSTPDGKPNGQMTDMGCAGKTNTCNDPNSTNEMYREWWYTGVVTISACSKWLFSVNVSERDRDFLTNLQIQPSWDHNLYVEATIDNVAARRQSSPYFTVQAPINACSGSPFKYNGGVVDPDGDSLVYKIIQPRSATGDLFVICAGYPPMDMPFAGPQFNVNNNPLETGNSFVLNQNTGDISFTPVGAQASYIALLVEKYRSGVLIGSVMRDWRMQVKDCNTPPTQVSVDPASISGGTYTRDTVFACGNTELNFCFSAGSSAGSAVLKVKDNSKMALKNAVVTYENQGTGNVKGCVRWTPPAGDVGFRYFVVSIKDSSCGPNNDGVIQSFRIPVMVRPGTELLTKDTVVCEGADVKLFASGGGSYTWSASPQADFSCLTCDTTLARPKADITRFRVSSSLPNSCRSADTLTVYLDRSTNIEVDPDTIVLCDGGEYVTLNAQAGGARPLKTIACGPYSPVTENGLTEVSMAQTSNNSFSSNAHYIWAEYWGPFTQSLVTQKTQVIIRKEELRHEGMKPGTIQRMALNFANFKKGIPAVDPRFDNVKISMRCTDKFEFVTPNHSEFEIGLTEVYNQPSVTLKPGWNEFVFTIPYDYDTTKNLVVQFCYSGVMPARTGYYSTDSLLPIYYVTTPYRSSIRAGQTSPGVACNANLGAVVTDIRRPDMRFSFSELPEDKFSYKWSPADGMDNPGAASTGVFPEKTTWYTVATKGRHGCEVKDSVLVYVAEKDFAVDPAESLVCLGEVVRIKGIGGYRYSWFNDNYERPEGFTCLNCDTPNILAPLGKNFYKVVIADFYGCSDTLDASIEVKPIPQTRILNNDTTIGYGQSVQLVAEGAAYYLWNPMESLNNPAIASPVATPNQSTLYIVSGFDPDGCVIKDSVWVRIMGGNSVFIPTAFSPNGDGVNDVFKIENLVHQKILSFAIFNRWGKEVYRSGLNQNGWDGTYKGQPAAMDTYYYRIELAAADGSTDVYKGDLTLIR